MSSNEDAKAYVARGAHAEQLHFPAQTIQLLADRADTDGAVSFIRSTLMRGADGARPHHHKTTTELFYMLDGRLDVLVGDDVISIGKGDLASVPAGMMHAFAASAADTADMLIIVAPGIDKRFDYFRLLHRLIAGEAQIGDVLATQEQFDNWFADSAVWTSYRQANHPG